MRFEKVREQIEKVAAIGVHPEGGTNRVFGTEEYREGLAAMERYFIESGLDTYVDPVGNLHGILRCQNADAGEKADCGEMDAGESPCRQNADAGEKADCGKADMVESPCRQNADAGEKADCGKADMVESPCRQNADAGEKPGRREPEEILVGSHLDTVKQGGKFDGLLGVVAAVEAAKEAASTCALRKNIHIIGTNGEEGNECGGTFGSRAMMGLLPLEKESYLQTAAKYGYTKRDMERAILDTSRACCYLELHIEQGPTLANRGEQIGVVTGIVGLRRYKVTVHGTSNHAGTTMMEDRQDALVQAARLILMGDDLARETGHSFVETVGVLQVFPSSIAVIPGRVEMVLEMRNESEERMDRFLEEYSRRAREIGEISIEPIVAKDPVKCGAELVETIENVCRREKVLWRRMPSGATHDGNAFAAKVPVGMIFVPSEKGISHSKDEDTRWEDVDRGAAILTEVIREIGSAG